MPMAPAGQKAWQRMQCTQAFEKAGIPPRNAMLPTGHRRAQSPQAVQSDSDAAKGMSRRMSHHQSLLLESQQIVGRIGQR